MILLQPRLSLLVATMMSDDDKQIEKLANDSKKQNQSNDKDPRRNNVTNRRAILRSIGATATLYPLISNVTADESKTELQVARNSDGLPLYENIPKEWQEHRRQVEEVKPRADEQFLEMPGVRSVAVTNSSESVKGMKRPQIKVKIDKGHPQSDQTVEKVPADIEGIPIETEVRGFDVQLECDSHSFRDPTGGGLICEIDHDTGYSTQTMCAEVDYNGTKGMLTTAHGYWQGSCSDFEADSTYHDEISWINEVGEPKHWNLDHDWAIISDSNADISTSDEIMTYDGNMDTYYACDDTWVLMANESEIFKTGASSDHTTGVIEDVDESVHIEECIHYVGGAFYSTLDSADGDSGAPVYTYAYGGDNPTIVGMHVAGHNEGNNYSQCLGNTLTSHAYAVELHQLEDDGIEFLNTHPNC